MMTYTAVWSIFRTEIVERFYTALVARPLNDRHSEPVVYVDQSA